MLECREALALAPDQGTERVSLLAVADDVEAARLASLDLDATIAARAASTAPARPPAPGRPRT